MKVIKLGLFQLLMVLSLSLNAQWSIGFSGGYALNHYDYDPQYMTGMDYRIHHGFAIDVPVKYSFNESFSLSTGIALQQKGYVLHGSFVPDGSDTALVFYPKLIRNDYYLSLPALAEFSFGNDKWRGLAGVGAYAGWWIRSAFAYQEIQSVAFLQVEDPRWYKWMTDEVDLKNESIRRIEFGLIGELGIERIINKKFSLFFVAKCHYALTPQQLDYQIKQFPSRNTTATAQIGFMYNIGN